MLRSPPQRPVSPANTTFSGISNYRSESYRPKDSSSSKPPAVPSLESRLVAKAHYEELTTFLVNHLTKESQGSRSNAREKLTKLTPQQFQELSTDVYDELVRRMNNSTRNEVPFLPVREDFHPKRNQARQKLATLPQLRFKDLSSDVYYELGRRYPEFKEEAHPLPTTPASPNSAYDDASNPPPSYPQASRMAEEIAFDSSTSTTLPRRRPSQQQQQQQPPLSSTSHSSQPSDSSISAYRRPLQDSQRERIGGGRPSFDAMSTTSSLATSRRPSRGGSERDRDRDRERDSSSVLQPAPPPVTAKSGVVIPTTSYIAEEDPIEVPFGDNGNGRRDRERDRDTDPDDHESESEFGRSPKSPEAGGLSALSARLAAAGISSPSGVADDSDAPPSVATGPGTSAGGGIKSSDEYYDKVSFGRASVASDRSGGAPLSRSASKMGRDRERESIVERDKEDLKRDYEFKIATLQKKANSSEEKVKLLEDELMALKERAEDHSNAMRALQLELDDVRSSKESERRQLEEEKEKEVNLWRERYQRAEEERTTSEEDTRIIEELRGEMEGLFAELNDLQARNDELMSAKEEVDLALQEAENQSRDWKRKYEQAKTELRGVKATSQLFLQTPDFEDTRSVPISADGGVLDIHLTAFQSAVDGLLMIGRSASPTKVLTPMKSVVESASAMLEDIRAYERRPPRGADVEAVRSLHERLEDTLSNLVIAARNHAQSYGLSPVSLLDAAASHVSSTVVELAKCVHIRKATKAEQDSFAKGASGASVGNNMSVPMSPSLGNSFSPKLRSLDEVRRQRNGSTGSNLRSERSPPPSGSGRASIPNSRSSSGPVAGGGSKTMGYGHRHVPSEPSSSIGSASPPIFDTPLQTSNANVAASDESGTAENLDDAWAELKPYLEAQSESMVYAIQSVLSAVRSPVPSASLNEHLTQIITIVSSIVAVCKDNLPPSSAAAGQQILRELSEHCDRLSEVQAQSEVTKESRQTMAKSSFAVANGMKSLMKL